MGFWDKVRKICTSIPDIEDLEYGEHRVRFEATCIKGNVVAGYGRFNDDPGSRREEAKYYIQQELAKAGHHANIEDIKLIF